MKCDFGLAVRDIDERIEQYLQGSLSPDRTAAFEEHLLNCEGCLLNVRVRQIFRLFIAEKGSEHFPDLLTKASPIARRKNVRQRPCENKNNAK